MKRLTTLAAAAAAILSLTLAGCSAPDAATPDTPGTDLLASHNLTDMSAREIVDTLDRMNVSDRPNSLDNSATVVCRISSTLLVPRILSVIWRVSCSRAARL